MFLWTSLCFSSLFLAISLVNLFTPPHIRTVFLQTMSLVLVFQKIQSLIQMFYLFFSTLKTLTPPLLPFTCLKYLPLTPQKNLHLSFWSSFQFIFSMQQREDCQDKIFSIFQCPLMLFCIFPSILGWTLLFCRLGFSSANPANDTFSFPKLYWGDVKPHHNFREWLLWQPQWF